MSLQAEYSMLKREVGRFADSGRLEADWDSTQELDIEDVLAKGQRKFYWSAIDPETAETYHWTFLEEEIGVDLQIGTAIYPLPPNFSSAKDDFLFPAGSGKPRLSKADAGELRALLSTEGKTGTPRYYATQPRASAPGDRSLQELIVYPIPDAAITLAATCEIEPELIDVNNTYPRGGAVHSETILEACLCAAEEILFPEAGPGIHAAKFAECLARSIEEDRRTRGTSEVWPDDPLEDGVTDLSVNKKYLMRVIGKERGYGPHIGTWKHNQRADVLELLRTGCRDFYTPDALGERRVHFWSFLEPTHRLTLEAGKYAYDMPPEFSAVRGPIKYAPGTGLPFPEIELTSPNTVLDILSRSDDTFYAPSCAFFRVKDSDEHTGTRWEMVVAPNPSGGEQITIPYAINPNQLGDDDAFPMGGQPHAQTLIESCLAAAERANKDGSNVHQQRFLAKLQASVFYDQEANCPRTMGISRDTSDNVYSETLYGENHYGDYHLTEYVLD